ncbi:MAG: hypothetical protein AW07_01664 [Candidatus Accumulibacter sp. SK-11]|nr:MAG: hypothetical protein AW07_01664 [Candidatus Accumulibacter sp. SK-11]
MPLLGAVYQVRGATSGRRRSAFHGSSYARVTVAPERSAHKVMVELAIGAPHPRTWPLSLAEVVRLAGRRRMALKSRQELCAPGLGSETADPGHAKRPAGPAMYLARRLAAWTSGSRVRGGSRSGGKKKPRPEPRLTVGRLPLTACP